MEDRKGFLLPEQEQFLDDIIVLSGVYEAMDGVAIRLADNVGLEKLKTKVPAEVLPLVYDVLDQVFEALMGMQKK